MKKTITLIISLLIISGGVIAWNYYRISKNQPVGPAVCTQEAKLCPNGSYVGRTGPNCEFQACPIPTVSATGWKTFTDTAQGINFQYPEMLGTKYISTQEWPPKVSVSNGAYKCLNTSPDPSRGLSASADEYVMNGIKNCVAYESEGAAGSIYGTYTYTFQKNGKLISLNFALRKVQCDNYPDPQKTECWNEHYSDGFSGIDSIIEKMESSIILQ